MTDASSHDARIVEQFSRWAAPFADNPIHGENDGMAKSLAAAALSPNSRVLDVACGPGLVACAAAARAAHVTGLDLTPAMLDQARLRQRSLGLHNMDWQLGDATALPFPDSSFDVVMTRYSFHHMLRPAAALAEMRRVCRPDGRIVVIDCTPSPETQAAYDAVEQVRDPSHASALTPGQLGALGRDAGLVEIARDGYRLEARVATVTDEKDMPALAALLEADIAEGHDRLGVKASSGPDGLVMRFPVSIVAWARG